MTRVYVLYAVSAILLVLMAIAAFYSPSGAWPLCIAAVGCIFLANLDRFSEISATTSGVTATLREARDSAADLRKMIEVSSEIQLSLLQQTGRWGSLGDEEKDNFLERSIAVMKEAGVSDSRIDEIRRNSWDRYVLFDYLISVSGNATIPEGVDQNTVEEWKRLRDFSQPATPEELSKFIDRIGDKNPQRRKLLDAYDHYFRHREHKDLALWKSRQKVPRLKSEQP